MIYFNLIIIWWNKNVKFSNGTKMLVALDINKFVTSTFY